MGHPLKTGFSCLLAATASMIFTRCTNPNGPDHSGTATETENVRVAGTLYQPDGVTPASGVTVAIRPRSSLADTTGFGLGKNLADTATVTTDDSGRFVIDSVDTGTYTIEGSSDNDRVLIDSVSVQESDTTVELDPDTLMPAGALKGVIKLSEGGDPRKVFVLAFGIDRFASVDSLGRFRFQNLAEASYDLRIISTLDDYGVLDTTGVPVISADTTDLDSIELPYTGIPTPKGLSLAYDTLKQIVTLTWNQADTSLVSGYNIYRQHADSGSINLNSAPVTDTTYSDSTVLQDQRYTYKVKSLDKDGNEGLLSVGVGIGVVSAFELSDTIGAGTLQGFQRIAVDALGKLYVADIVDPNWSLYVYGTNLTQEKSINSITAKYPYDLEVDSMGNIYLMNQDGIVVLDSSGSPTDTLIVFANNENKQFILSDSAIFFTSGVIGKYNLVTDALEASAMISADGLIALENKLFVGGQTNKLRIFDLNLNADTEWILAFEDNELPRILETDEKGRIYVFGYHFNPHSFTILIYDSNRTLLSQLSLAANVNALEVFNSKMFVVTDAGILVYE